MSEASPPPRPREDYQIGETVPLPRPKLSLWPKGSSGKGRGPRGVFQNGGNTR